ncbi:MAG: phosphopantetheine-binding protein [bacterium]|nr:phosphopantetheine-binding protein [bacterium]
MEIKNKVREFLKTETQKEITNDSENLITSGVLDSFSMIKLITFIESELKIKVDMEKLSAENFNSIEKIDEFLR